MRNLFFETKHALLLAVVLLGFTASSQVVVNEFCFANYTDWALGGGWGADYEDWIEFYNPTGADINLEGYWLSDNPANVQKFELPDANVPAGGYLIVIFTGMWDADPYWNGYINTTFKVTQTGGESLIFAEPDGTVVDQWEFGADVTPLQANYSYGRTSDGANDWAIMTNPSPEGPNGGATGSGFAPAPIFDQEAGYYAGGTTVTMSAGDGSLSLYYTLDGSEPTDASTPYTGPIDIDQTTVVRAIAYDSNPDILPGWVETNTYFVGDDNHTLPIFSVSGGTLSDGQWNGDELMWLEMFDSNGDFVVEANGDSNEHGNDSNAYDQRGWDFVVRDAIGYDNEVEEPIFHHRTRPSYERLIFKAAANDNYTFSGGAHMRDAYCHELSIRAGLKLDERATEYCIIYINGEYWGVYDVREKADDIDFTNYYYDQPQNYIWYLKTWGGTWEEYGPGCQAEWNDLRDFITGNDMSDPANYDYVTDQYNQTSLIDYFTLNSYVVCADWLNWNTAWWKGIHPDGDAKRWRYVLWDLDNTFGHGANYTGLPDTGSGADPCNPDNLGDPGGQGHVPILNALFDNEDFTAEYINRYASLSNSYFSCDFMIYMVDSMEAVIDPEMERQCQRWGGTYNGWVDNVQEVRDFILDRCSDELVSGLEDCYDVESTTLTILVNGLGLVEVQGIATVSQADAPWEGDYFIDLPIELEAIIDAGIFLGWEVVDGDVTIDDPTNPDLTITLTGPATIVANFDTNLDPELVMYDVQPAGAGDILVDGVPMGPYPNTVLTDGGLHLIEATENQWFVFDHWEMNNANINPDDEEQEATFLLLEPDTLVAFYTEIPHFDITVDVMPAGAGTITMDGNPLASYPWSGTVEGDVDINFQTIPTDIWSQFSHWEVNNHVVMPDEFSMNMILNLTAEDEIVAVYNVIPNYGITVIVEPPFGGSVAVGNTVMVQDSWTGQLEGATDLTFLASPSPYWNFTGWKANYHAPSPDADDRQVMWNFNAYDTVWAFFEPEEFAMYIPNSFTPNNDGRNDVFLPIGNAVDVTDFSFQVFNRWGDLVFETTDVNTGWTGSHQQGDYFVKDEIYMYRMSVKSVHDLEEKEYMGHIMVFR